MAAGKRRRDPKARPFAEKLLSQNPNTTYTEASKAAKAASVHLTPTLYYMIKKEQGIGSRRGRPPKAGARGRTAKAANVGKAMSGRRGGGRAAVGSANGNPIEQLAAHVRELTRERDRYRALLAELRDSLDAALA